MILQRWELEIVRPPRFSIEFWNVHATERGANQGWEPTPSKNFGNRKSEFRGLKKIRKSEIGIPRLKKISEIGIRNSEPKNVGNRISEIGNRKF